MTDLHDSVDVWWLSPEEVSGLGPLAHCQSLLNEEERSRQARFLLPADRHRFLVAHAMLRRVLSDYAGHAPTEWSFVCNAFGRPEIDFPTAARWLRFNLSHTQGLVACAVTRDCDVGVDAEFIGRRLDDEEKLAERFFSRAESRELARHAPPHRRRRFFDYWTLKEAYVKAHGQGLSLGLDTFSMEIPGEGAPRISFADGRTDEPSQWQFTLAHLSESHTLALALRRGRQRDREVAIRHFAPARLAAP